MAFYVSLISRPSKQQIILSYIHDDELKCEAYTRKQLQENDSYTIINISEPPRIVSETMKLWFAEIGIPQWEMTQMVKNTADKMFECLSSQRKKNKKK